MVLGKRGRRKVPQQRFFTPHPLPSLREGEADSEDNWRSGALASVVLEKHWGKGSFAQGSSV